MDLGLDRLDEIGPREVGTRLAVGAHRERGGEPPPGGPIDQTPPVLVGTVPESLGVFPDFDDRVEFRFNEVVSEGSSPNLGFGTGTLEQLIILSPSERVPRVAWRRTSVAIPPGA